MAAGTIDLTFLETLACLSEFIPGRYPLFFSKSILDLITFE